MSPGILSWPSRALSPSMGSVPCMWSRSRAVRHGVPTVPRMRELPWGQEGQEGVPWCWKSQRSARGSPRGEIRVAAGLLPGGGRGHPCMPGPARSPLQLPGERLCRKISSFSTEVDDFILQLLQCLDLASAPQAPKPTVEPRWDAAATAAPGEFPPFQWQQ